MKIITSGLIDELKGSLNGTTFQVGKYGLIARNKPMPHFRQDVNLSTVRNSLFNSTKLWKSLSCSDKSDWEAAASSGRFGYYKDGITPLTGYHAFIKGCQLFNMIQLITGGFVANIPESCPAEVALPTNLGCVVSADFTTGTINLQPEALQEFDANVYVLCYVSKCFPCAAYSKPTRYTLVAAFTLSNAYSYDIAEATLLSKQIKPINNYHFDLTTVFFNYTSWQASPIYSQTAQFITRKKIFFPAVKLVEFTLSNVLHDSHGNLPVFPSLPFSDI